MDPGMLIMSTRRGARVLPAGVRYLWWFGRRELVGIPGWCGVVLGGLSPGGMAGDEASLSFS